MSAEVFDSINELKKVFAPNAHLFTVINEENVSELSSVAESSRDKMIEILNQFYKDHNHSSEGVDDFVTLFGVYCNYYFLYGLHLILKEDDFGTTKIFENISDSSLKTYLSLIRSAIHSQEIVLFEEAVETNKNYSLAHFYLFLHCLCEYHSQRVYDPDQEKTLQDALLNHYNAIRNEKLKKYALGLSDSIPRADNYVFKMANNFLIANLDSAIEEITKIDNESLDASMPPLPFPYLVTTEELRSIGYLIIARCSLRFIRYSITESFFDILRNEECRKDFSAVLSFITNEEKKWSDPKEFNLGVARFCKESKINANVFSLIINILLVLPTFLKDTSTFLHTLFKDNAHEDDLNSAFNSAFSDTYTLQKTINIGLEKIYSEGKSTVVSGMYNTLETLTQETIQINSKVFPQRSVFLKIPYEIKWTNQELSNLMERIAAQAEKDKVQAEKDTMVRDFMHVYSNMKADNLYDMAELFLKKDSPEDKETGRKLLLEYAVKMELKNSVRIMQLMYKDRVGELKDDIKKSLVSEEDEHENIGDVLNKALRQCFINIFYGDPQERASKAGTISKMHKNLEKIWGKNFLESKREQFEQQFMGPDFDCLKWLSQEGINFTCEQEPVWEKIFMAREGFSSTFLKTIFDELLVNAFKYGDLKREIRLHLSQNESKDLVISFENHFTRLRQESGSQIGLNLLRRRIQFLHEDTKKDCAKAVEDKIKGKDGKIEKRIFRIELILPATLFLDQSSLH